MLRLGSSLRLRPPEETFERARALMPGLGISRVTDVTRMDRLGLPVYASVRPRGHALRVHAGKGLRHADARVGALMEAVEYAAAEPRRSAWTPRTLRLDEFEGDWAGAFSLVDLAPRVGPAPPPSRRVEALRCDEVGGGRAAWLPAELLFVPFEPRHGPLLFGWSTNGLASGNSIDEATLHALLEVLERDALAMNAPRDASLLVEGGGLPAPFDAFAARWHDEGVELAVRYVPNEFGLPCFSAMLHETGKATVDLSAGFGLHLDASIALSRAVCEAAQSRLSHIHGARDDVTHFFGDRDAPGECMRDARDTPAFSRAFDATRVIAWADVPSLPCDDASVEAVLGTLVDRLRSLGFTSLMRHRFELDLGGLAVVKVVVPRCQELDGPPYRLGRRLAEKALADA